MRILIVNPPYQTMTCTLGVGHQTPLGLLMVGGPLVDAGHDVQLLDAEARRLSHRRVVRAVREFGAEIVMTGHAGSTPAHPVSVRMLRAIKQACPDVVTVYGGVYPTFHAAEIVKQEPAVDVVVRGEGEATALDLVSVLAAAPPGQLPPGLGRVPGIAFRAGGDLGLTPERPPIENLDDFRVGWELIDDWDRCQCFGLGRAAVVQFSRGCPHQCTFCGQPSFWKRWRHRDPVKAADQVEFLHREHGVRFCHLSDDNPSTDQAVWRRFLEELASRALPVRLYATIRASDIVRDAQFLSLYRRAGILYVLMGIESTDPDVLKRVKKGSAVEQDYLACQLLRQHGIFSVAGHLVGFEHETWADFRTARERLARYDPDWVNVMYVTPHDWTEFGAAALGLRVIEPDLRKWDYRHPVLAQRHLKPWQLFLAAKWLELRVHIRSRRLWRVLLMKDRFLRRQLLWSLLHTSPIWAAEIIELVARGVLRPRLRTASGRKH